MIYYIIISILFILLIISFSFYIKVKKEKNSIIENKNKKIKEEWERENQILKKKYDELNSELGAKLNEVNTAINQHYADLKEEREKQLESDIEKEKSILNLRMQRELDQERASRLEEIKDTLETCVQFNNQRIEELNARTQWYEEQSARAAEEYSKIMDILEDFKARRQVVNNQILREKEIQEKTDFYRIQLSKNDIEDLNIIKDIEHKFNNKEVLHKAAYDCYIKRPLIEMEKRVLNGRKISGIYIITYVPTGEFYIGRSVDIANRWQEHSKTAMGLDGAASSSLHVKMARDGIWNFTFQILEEVPKEKLNEREKYWIDLYGAQSLLNQRQGG